MKAFFRHTAGLRILLIGTLALVLAAPAFAADGTPAPQPLPQSQPQQKPVRDMDAILQELRDLDSSQDMQGDHVVGEQLC